VQHRGTDKYTVEKDLKVMTQSKILSVKAVVIIGDGFWVFMRTGIK